MSFDLGYEDRNAWITTTNIPNTDNAPSSHQVRRACFLVMTQSLMSLVSVNQ